METDKRPVVKKKTETIKHKLLTKTGRIFLRWMYIMALVAAIAFSYFIWIKYVQNAEWSEQQKNDYINQQAVFSFNQDMFQQATDFLKNRKEKLQNPEKFSGKDIFFPEGF